MSARLLTLRGGSNRHFPRSVALLIGPSLVVSAINIRKRRSCRIIGQPHDVDIYAKGAAPRA
jgi:hypothetical protein